MNGKDKGGPAFPLADSNAEYERTDREHCNGMTLHDYFAAKAMQSIISRMDSAQYNYTGAETVASDAYAFADAMITARGWQS